MSAEMPDEVKRTQRIALAVLVGGLATVLVAGGLWVALRPRPDSHTQTRIHPAEETSAAVLPSATPGAGTVATPSAVASTAPGAPSTGTATPGTPAPPAMIAFRLGASIYVAAADGGSPKSIVRDASSAFSLSPDGRTLALTSSLGKLTLIDVATLAQTAVPGIASDEAVAWAPDSKWFAFTAPRGPGLAVMTASAVGPKPRLLAAPGSAPVVSRDGKRVAYAGHGSPSAVSLAVADVASGRSKPLQGTEGATGWAWGGDGALYFTVQGDEDAWALVAVSPNGQARAVASIQLEPPAYALSAPVVAPDCRYVVCTANGDDDYCRMVVFDVRSGWARTLVTRRDAYPAAWTPDSTRILYFEGNTYQGEASALMSVLPDGTGRRAVITGATR